MLDFDETYDFIGKLNRIICSIVIFIGIVLLFIEHTTSGLMLVGLGIGVQFLYKLGFTNERETGTTGILIGTYLIMFGFLCMAVYAAVFVIPAG